MKRKMLGLVSVMLLGTMSLFAQDKTEKIKVYGACGMCESRIEKTANALDGVTSADWDKETHMLEVKYDTKMTDIKNVHVAMAKVGHDTDMKTAKDEVYNNLPACCKYDRPAKKEKK